MKKVLLVLILIVSVGLLFGQERTAEDYIQEREERNQTFQTFVNNGDFQPYLSQGMSAVRFVYQEQSSNLQAIQDILDNPDFLQYVVNPPALELWKLMLARMRMDLNNLYSIALSEL